MELDDQLCFSLYSASKAMTARYRPMLERMGITYPQYLVLMVLWEDDDLGVNELGRRLDLDSGTMSPLLKRLEAAGLVTRTRNPTDERVVHIRLTDAGRALEQPACVVSGAMAAAVQMERAEIDALKAQLDALTARLTGQHKSSRR